MIRVDAKRRLAYIILYNITTESITYTHSVFQINFKYTLKLLVLRNRLLRIDGTPKNILLYNIPYTIIDVGIKKS